MTSYWAKMPCDWQTDRFVHLKLRELPCGEAIAALKLYITFCLKANFKADGKLAQAGCVRQSLVALGLATGLSKPMVIKGLSALVQLDLVQRLGGRPATYLICRYETASYWAKLPTKYLQGAFVGEVAKIARLSNRGQQVFEALQFYLYIAATRDKATLKAKITYDTLSSVLRMSRNAVSRAISYLVEQKLISLRPDPEAERYPCNVYWLVGRFKEEPGIAAP